MNIDTLRGQIAACRVCAWALPHEPRPVVTISQDSRLLLIGQAPGRRVHESGVPWDDASGELLRDWLGISREAFYDPKVLSILPMGFCFPGNGSSGDLPPRPECAPLWHPQVLPLLTSVKLTILIGSYAVSRYLPDFSGNLTEAVQMHHKLLPDRIALPHPSPRNRPWLAKNPWFQNEVLPVLRSVVTDALS